MAIVVLARVALAVTPFLVRMASTSSADEPARAWVMAQDLWQRLQAENESDEDLSVALSDALGYDAFVATYTGTFELRRLQVKFDLLSGGVLLDDARITTYDFLRLSGGAPSDAWGSTDFTAIETAFNNAWGNLKALYDPQLRLSQYRWYKVGPAIIPPQEPVRIVDNLVVGTASTTGSLPTQVAVSVTEMTASRKAWGRVYWPAPAVSSGGAGHGDHVGRWTSAFCTTFANTLDTFYEACRAANVFPVVYSPAKPERPKKPSGTLPATVARALTVDTIQVDDVPDVIRSRRLKAATLKVQRGLT